MARLFLKICHFLDVIYRPPYYFDVRNVPERLRGISYVFNRACLILRRRGIFKYSIACGGIARDLFEGADEKGYAGIAYLTAGIGHAGAALQKGFCALDPGVGEIVCEVVAGTVLDYAVKTAD